MKKLLFILGAILFGVSLTQTPVAAKADEQRVDKKSFWNSLSYSCEEIEGGLSFTGTSTWGDIFYSAEKVDLNGYKLDLEFVYDFNETSTNFDWFGVIWAPGNKPFVNSGAALSLIFRPQSSSTYFAFMTNTFAEVAFDRVQRTNDKYSIEIALTESSISATVNGVTISTDSNTINYKLLNRGVYNAFTANGGTDFQNEPAGFILKNMNFKIHDSSKDIITYGATISMNDENMKNLASENFKVVEKEKEQSTGCGGSILSTSIIMTCLSACMISAIIYKINRRKKDNIRKGVK